MGCNSWPLMPRFSQRDLAEFNFVAASSTISLGSEEELRPRRVSKVVLGAPDRTIQRPEKWRPCPIPGFCFWLLPFCFAWETHETWFAPVQKARKHKWPLVKQYRLGRLVGERRVPLFQAWSQQSTQPLSENTCGGTGPHLD